MEAIYLGSFDDRVEVYPWNKKKINIECLNNILLTEVFFNGKKLIINDGYLVNSPVIRDALCDEKKSPLLNLIKKGFVKILYRKDQSLDEMIKYMADQGQETFQSILKYENYNTKWKPLFDDISEYLINNNSFVKWPKYDISDGFLKLIRSTYDKEMPELGLKITNKNLYRRIIDDFENKMSQNKSGPRDKWEKTLFKYDINVRQELMEFANCAYHYNWGLCLQADNDFLYKEILINSKCKFIFQNYLRKMTETDCDISKLNISLPKNININDELLDELLTPNKELYNCRANYLEQCKKFISNLINEAQLNDSKNEYINMIKKSARNKANLNNWIIAGDIAISMVAFLLTSFFSGNYVLGFTAAVATGGLGSVTLNTLMKRLLYIGKKKKEYKFPRIEYENLIGSLEISKDQADDHVKGINIF